MLKQLALSRMSSLQLPIRLRLFQACESFSASAGVFQLTYFKPLQRLYCLQAHSASSVGCIGLWSSGAVYEFTRFMRDSERSASNACLQMADPH